MKKVYLSSDEEVVYSKHLRLLEQKAKAHDEYLSATQYMTGYMQVTNELLHNTHDPVYVARLKGRIEAIASFDRAIADRAWRGD